MRCEYSLAIKFPVLSVVQVNTHMSVFLHHLLLSPKMEVVFSLVLDFLKSTTISFILDKFKEVIDLTPCHKVDHQFPVLSSVHYRHTKQLQIQHPLFWRCTLHLVISVWALWRFHGQSLLQATAGVLMMLLLQLICGCAQQMLEVTSENMGKLYK